MNEHELRLRSMIRSPGKWDLSPNDVAAIQWAVNRIDDLERQLATKPAHDPAAALFDRLSADFSRDVSDTPGLTDREVWLLKKMIDLALGRLKP